ncbi:MAG: ATP-dependent Clp protease ATP-binding subunit [candidate division WOR-3 bacterium]
MFIDEGFTKKLIDVIKIAKDIAKGADLEEVTPLILFLALLKHRNNTAVTIMDELGIDIDMAESRIMKFLSINEERMKSDEPIGLSESCISIMEQAKEEALMLGKQVIGTEHLLLALLKSKESSFVKILRLEPLEYYSAKRILLDLFEREIPQDKEKTKSSDRTLEFYTRDLTELAREGKIDPVIGREGEIERVIQTLCRRKKNNPVLVGEPGVGKTAIVEGLAQRIVSGRVPKVLQNKRILSLDLASVIAGTKYRGQFEKRLKQILDSLRESNYILFIDEIHTIVGAGAAEGAIDASNMLKPVLASGEIQTIGATTHEEYRKYIEKDGALERRLQMIIVEPPTIEETIEILKGIKRKYEDFHKVIYPDDVIAVAVKLSAQYIQGRNLPDKAIDVLDETGARVRLRETKVPDEIVKLEEELREVKEKLVKAREEGRYEVAIELRDKRDELEEKLERSLQEWGKYGSFKSVEVTEDDIREVVSLWTGIPLKRLKEEETERLLSMEKEIKKRVVGQDEAVKVVSQAIRRSRAGLRDMRRPLGAFLFLGPTGVGKTELAKQLARFLFNTEDALIRIDMSEFMERFNVSKLIGAPPGYVGYEEGGTLTEAVRRRPYAVVLLDEIEKAHPEVYNILLQVFDEGILTDACGRKISFRNTVIIMTSNIGTKEIMQGTHLGFKKSGKIEYEEMKEYLLEEIKNRFNPEFLNRIDECVVFRPLDRKMMSSIVDIFFDEVKKRVEEKGFEISLTEEAKEFLIEKGFDPEFGARPLKRIIQRELEDKLAEAFLKGEWKEGSKIVVAREGNDLIFFTSHSVAEVI